jgi:hypothetical protein
MSRKNVAYDLFKYNLLFLYNNINVGNTAIYAANIATPGSAAYFT